MENELVGKKVAVLVETEYIHEEIDFYEKYFTSLGAQVNFITYLFGKPERTIICDITDTENPTEHIHTMKVYKDFDQRNPNIVKGAYVMDCDFWHLFQNC